MVICHGKQGSIDQLNFKLNRCENILILFVNDCQSQHKEINTKVNLISWRDFIKR